LKTHFTPFAALAPCQTLVFQQPFKAIEILEERHISQADLALRKGRPKKTISSGVVLTAILFT